MEAYHRDNSIFIFRSVARLEIPHSIFFLFGLYPYILRFSCDFLHQPALENYQKVSEKKLIEQPS